MARGAATEGSDSPAIEENAAAKPHPRALVMEMLWQNPGVVATLGYLYLTVIGIAFTVFFFLEFGVPIAVYSEPTDFVIAGLREPVLFVYSVASIVFLKRMVRRDRKLRERSASYRRIAERMEASRWYNEWVVSTAVVVVYFAAATFLYARFKADRIRSGHAPRVVVDLNAPAGGEKQLGATGSLMLLGANSKYVFVYDRLDSRVRIVPVNNVAEITEFRPARAVTTVQSSRMGDREVQPATAAR